jgi:hypothetical protein
MDEQAIIADLNNGIVDSSIDDSIVPIKTSIMHEIIIYAQEENPLIRTVRAAHIETFGISDIETKLETIKRGLKAISEDETKTSPEQHNAAWVSSLMGEL